MPTKCSVVIPAFNCAPFIGATIESILAQTFVDFELIVSDHMSSDRTWTVLQTFEGDPRIKLCQFGSHGGAPANWNFVTSLATGEFVKVVCHDDLLAPNCLEKQITAFDSSGAGVVMVAARRDIIDVRGRVMARARGLGHMNGQVDGHAAIRASVRSGTNLFGEPAGVLVRRKSLEDIGGWQDARGYVTDLATYIQLLARGDLVAIPESLASFRVSVGQWSVELARNQSAQVCALFQEAAELAPERVSAIDLVRGKILARLRAYGRRLVYIALPLLR